MKAAQEALMQAIIDLKFMAQKDSLKAAYKLAHGESVEKRIVLPYEMVTEENAEQYIADNF